MQDTVIQNATARAENLSIRLETVTEITVVGAKRYSMQDTVIKNATVRAKKKNQKKNRWKQSPK